MRTLTEAKDAVTVAFLLVEEWAGYSGIVYKVTAENGTFFFVTSLSGKLGRADVADRCPDAFGVLAWKRVFVVKNIARKGK